MRENNYLIYADLPFYKYHLLNLLFVRPNSI